MEIEFSLKAFCICGEVTYSVLFAFEKWGKNAFNLLSLIEVIYEGARASLDPHSLGREYMVVRKMAKVPHLKLR